MKAKIAAIEAKSTSPANILPNNRKESEATFAISPISSSSPTKKVIGATRSTVGSFITLGTIDQSALILTYLLKVLHKPIAIIPKKFDPRTIMMLKARVVLTSAVPERKNGTKAEVAPSFTTKPIEPKIGKRPSQLLTKIKIKRANTSGKILTESLRSFVTWSTSDKAPSKIISKICWILPGIFFIFIRNAIENARMTKTASQEVSKELVT